ncbi:AlbA family DNA-binding domain-containing protein [Sphingomonas sp. CLY1604]|uniref:AlbA family DNA-binding domain-containing protein n=1 Tax=Sphingomonas sp. CLY1604 TaxID=3457786 RepID=UPI003FD71B30
MRTVNVSASEAAAILQRSESHFFDFKSKRILPSKLSRTISALANAEGGDLYIGIEDPADGIAIWDGFTNEEEANSLLQVFHDHYPEGEVFS